MRRLGELVVRFRWAVVAAWAGAAVASLALLPSLSSVVDPDTSSFLPSTSPAVRAAALSAPFQPARDGTATLVFARGHGGLGTADLTAIARAEQAVARVPDVTGVRDDGLSADGAAARAQISTDVPAHGAAAERTTRGIRAAVAGSSLPAGLQAHATGKLATDTDNADSQRAADRRTELLTNLVVLVMLLVVFRSLLAPLVTLAPAALVLFAGGDVIAELARHGAFDVSTVARTLFTVLVIGAGTDYGLFLILRLREELERGADPHEGVRRALAGVGESIATSGGTVILALLSLLLASFGLYYGMGPTLAIGVALLLLAALTLLPALLAILGARVFWPRRIGTGAARAGAWSRLGEQVLARPGTTLAGGAALFVALALCSVGFRASGFAGTSRAPDGSDSARGDALLARHFPGSARNPTTVVLRFGRSLWSDPTPLEAAQRSLAGSGLFASVDGLLDPNGTQVDPAELTKLHAKLGAPGSLPAAQPPGTGLTARRYEGYRASAQFLSADGRTALFATALAAGFADSRAAKDTIPAVRRAADAAAKAAGAEADGVGGLAAAAHDVGSVSASDLHRIVPLVLVLIGLLLMLALRSVVAPLYLIASVALSYVAALGLAVVVFAWLGGADGIDFVLPFLMFVFLMALGEDYNILVMTRIREEAARLPLRDAIAAALRATGASVTSAGLVLAATFGVAGLSGATSQVRQLAAAIALGVLLDTFLVRTLLVPALAALLGRWNWWPSQLGRATPEAPSTAASLQQMK